MDSDRMQKLLDLYFDEVLDEETAEEFGQHLLASPKAREMFWEQAKLHGMLRQIGQEAWGDSALPESEKLVPESQTTIFASQTIRYAAVFAFFLACVAGMAIFFNTKSGKVISRKDNTEVRVPQNIDAPIQAESHPQWVAFLRRESNVEWNNPEEAMIAGEAMTQRPIAFSSGLVEIQTNRGVTLTVEGPADLEVLSGMEVMCRKGRLRVDVPPPAIGFVVSTPKFDVVDRGTSFAMDVDGEKNSEVLVIKGKVEVVSDDGAQPKRRELLEGEAIGIADGVFKNISYKEAEFTSSSGLSKIIRDFDSLQFDTWKQKRDLLSQDPSCISYFDFQNEEETGVLINKSIHARPGNVGTIVGAQWVQGRWPGKQALEFRNTIDRVLFSVPGQRESITCLASVRIDSLNSDSLALLAPADPSNSSFRWDVVPSRKIDNPGYLRVQKFMDGEWGQIASSSTSHFIRQSRTGTWIQLAFVINRETGVYSEYVNGKLLSRSQLPSATDDSDMSLQLGQMQIGNHSEPTSGSTSVPAGLVGCVDELAIFDKALSHQEIRVRQLGRHASWKNAGPGSRWDNSESWHAGLTPNFADAIYIDQGEAVFSKSETPLKISAICVGSDKELEGELGITGGRLLADRSRVRHGLVSRIGFSGGKGSVLQEDGYARFNALQIGLGEGSVGHYRLEGGELLVTRSFDTRAGKNASLSIGVHRGRGRLEVAGGSLKTRKGIRLGQTNGIGTFVVEGSKPKRIAIGSRGNQDGFWVQESGSTLDVRIDAEGLTPVVIDEVDEKNSSGPYGDGHVTFKDGAILNVAFSGTPRSGTWDVMRWEGNLINDGLKFADNVDQDVWSFQFVDTDGSGSPDTLQVVANSDTP